MVKDVRWLDNTKLTPGWKFGQVQIDCQQAEYETRTFLGTPAGITTTFAPSRAWSS
jgi:hypothetical protein